MADEGNTRQVLHTDAAYIGIISTSFNDAYFSPLTRLFDRSVARISLDLKSDGGSTPRARLITGTRKLTPQLLVEDPSGVLTSSGPASVAHDAGRPSVDCRGAHGRRWNTEQHKHQQGTTSEQE